MSGESIITPKFSESAAPVPASAVRGERSEGAATETVRDKQDRITERAHAHFENQRPQWIAARYKQLLLQDAPAPALTPNGVSEDRSARLMRAATHLADSKQHRRLDRIREAGDKMMGVGKQTHQGR